MTNGEMSTFTAAWMIRQGELAEPLIVVIYEVITIGITSCIMLWTSIKFTLSERFLTLPKMFEILSKSSLYIDCS